MARDMSTLGTMGKHMPFTFDDGGRQAAGFRGSAGDCVTRAIAIASGIDYGTVYDRIAAGMASNRVTRKDGKRKTDTRRSARHGVYTTRKWFRDYMAEIGFEWVPTMAIGSGCRVHLAAAELPAGRLVVAVAKHYTAVIDGLIRDTFDPNDRPATVYQLDTPADVLPRGATLLENGNGWIHTPGPRCVYGYYRKAGKNG